MPKKTIRVIEPTMLFDSIENETIQRKKRVCAYARVSTDTDDQLNSYKVQIEEYTKRIKENNEWIFQGMYADEGISGTNMKKRVEFLRMLDDARTGKIDLVLTKSLSRFARNTVDSLTVIQELRSLNVDIYFEKENIYSSDTKVDFLLTIFSSIAQEESRNISENIKWGYRKKFQKGEVHINTKRFLGYDKDEGGNIVINEEQATTVRMIFNLYISGLSYKQISNLLTENEIKNGRDEVYWKPASITTIITNEKYCGDAILQKRVTIDYLTHKSVRNTGQAPKYHIMDNHIPIISREIFNAVQQIKKDRAINNKSSRYRNRYALSGIVYCGNCNKKLLRKHYNPNTNYSRIVLSCKNTGKSHCTNKPIDNSIIESACAETIHYLHKKNILDSFMKILKKNFNNSKYKKGLISIQSEIVKTEDEIKELIELRISSEQKNNKGLKEIYNEKMETLNSLQDKETCLRKNIADHHINLVRAKQIEDFIYENRNLISRDVLTTIIKRIIEVNQNEIVICISKNDIDKEPTSIDIEGYKKQKPIVISKIVKSGITLNYRVIEI